VEKSALHFVCDEKIKEEIYITPSVLLEDLFRGQIWRYLTPVAREKMNIPMIIN